MHYLRLSLALLFPLLLLSCTPPAPPPKPLTTQDPTAKILVDFESPETPMTWEPFAQPATSTSKPATQPTPLIRSSLRPLSGLWSAKITPNATSGGGVLTYTPYQPLDLGNKNLLQAGVLHLAKESLNGTWTAALRLEDAAGKKIEGDAFSITSRWDQVLYDLSAAFDDGLDLSHIVRVSLLLRPVPGMPPADSQPADQPPFEIQTDAWTVSTRARTYIGNRLATGGGANFFVESQSTRLRIGSTGSSPWEISLYDRWDPLESTCRHASLSIL